MFYCRSETFLHAAEPGAVIFVPFLGHMKRFGSYEAFCSESCVPKHLECPTQDNKALGQLSDRPRMVKTCDRSRGSWFRGYMTS